MKKLFLLLAVIVALPASAQRENESFILRIATWPTRTCAVCWENPTPAVTREMMLVQKAVSDTWERESKMRFTGWGPCPATSQGIRIRIEDRGPHCKGLGRNLNGAPDGMVLNFTYGNWSPGCTSSAEQRDRCTSSIAVHEFGHALGFAHEQNRRDCHFEGCEEEPQGDDGDWVTPCDISSVMNYCNPAYNNDGKLSFYDKQALVTFYGLPVVNSLALPNLAALRLVHTANLLDTLGNAALSRRKPGFNPITHQIKVYLTGADEELTKVKFVKYRLHPSFRRKKLKAKNPADKFGIGLRVWGEFEMEALVVFKDGQTKKLNRDLTFEPQDKLAK